MLHLFDYKKALHQLTVGYHHRFDLSEPDAHHLAERFRIPGLHHMMVDVACHELTSDYVDLTITLKGEAVLTCALTAEDFSYPLASLFIIRFLKHALSNDDDNDLLLIQDPPIYVETLEDIGTLSNMIDLGDIIIQYIALMLPDVPMSPDSSVLPQNPPTQDAPATEVQKPFASLGDLLDRVTKK